MTTFPSAIRVRVAGVTDKIRSAAAWLYTGLMLFLGVHAVFAQGQPQTTVEQQIRQTLKKNAQTIRFMENKGQLANGDVLYYYESTHGAVYIERNRIRFVAIDDTLLAQAPNPQTGITPSPRHAVKGTHTFSLYLDGANPGRTLELGESFKTRYNYITGADAGAWTSGVTAAKDLTLRDIYPGIDLRLYSAPGGVLEFDWLLKAGADYNKVNMRFEGQDSLAVDRDGSLNVGLRFSGVKFHIPESYQVTDRGKVPVDFAFHPSARNTIGFATKSKIDPRFPLVIDPILSWGTYFDGNSTDFDQYLFAIQTDPATKRVYCAGATNHLISTNTAPYDANGYLNNIAGLNGSQRVAIVYTLSPDGADLLYMTHYGPASVSSNDNVVAYALSLSANRVYIGGNTNVSIPTTGSPFDATINNGPAGNGDGFVAVFSKDLGTLHYATYLGSTNDETRGVTSIRALGDDSFVVGMTVSGVLPAGYLSGADTQYGTNGSNGGDDFYIAKFTGYNTLGWGTYLGGSSNDVFNDLEVFADGRVAFAGYGASTLTEVSASPAATSSSNTNNDDGILGILNATGTAFTYLDEIGGSGNDRIYDVTIFGNSLYWTGSAANGFPTTAGAYDTGYNGGTSDVIVGSVSQTGANYTATFYGTSGEDIGSAVKLVSYTDCSGVVAPFFLVFGTVDGDGLPTQNVNNESFFEDTNNGNLDMFFGGFNGTLSSLVYGTYIGGDRNDYLGDTGDPRGANHLWVEGADLYLGTTTHSQNHSPTDITPGSMDPVKETNSNSADTHIIFCLSFTSILQADYGDAPASYGAPAHIQNCPVIRIGGLTLDTEMNPIPSVNADGDDGNGENDEDGISVLPTVISCGPQDISVTVDNLINLTGADATLYAWIDFNSDGKFSASEFTSLTIPDGFTGPKVLTWTGITAGISTMNHYLRLRLTTDLLTDSPGTTDVDERSTAAASNGEVEDYLAPGVGATDLSVTKTVNNATPNIGGNVVFTIMITNSGQIAATNVKIGDQLPSGFNYVSDNGAGAYNSGTGVWTVGTLNTGQSKSLQITATVLATGSYKNTAQVTASDQPDCDSAPNNNVATEDDQSSASILIASGAATAALCNGGTGKITLTMNGVAPYDITWNGPGANDGTVLNQATGYMIPNLPAGSYAITVTDDSGVQSTFTTSVSEPAALSAMATPTAVICNGGSTGKITMALSGGTGLYDIAWDGPGANDGTALNQNTGYMIPNLPAGTYTITVTDDNSCTKTTSATVNQATALMASAAQTAALCNGGTGKITMTISGGATPYDIAWDGPGANDGTALNQATGYMIANLPAGAYNITITDDNGCTKTTSATVQQPSATVTATATPTHVLCNGGTGKITLTLSGGASPYDVAWDGPGANDGNTLNQNSGYMITNLPAGSYTITVTDDNGCSTNTSTTINQPAALTASATPTNASCTGDTNGKITMTIGGGTTPYDITWDGPGANDGTANNQATGYMIANLPEGNYAITVTDDNGCTKTTSATISANPLPVCSISDAMGAVCPNSTGNQYSAPGGMDVYAWSISGNGSIPGAKNGRSVDVSAGASGGFTLTVTITKNGCSSTCMKQVTLSAIPFSIVFAPQFCSDDAGPVIGLSGSEVGAMYQLQTGGGANLGAPKPGTGTPITFGTYPNGAYKVVITGGTCNGTLTANVNATVGPCNISVPNFCTCSSANGYTEVTVKVSAPDGQTWKVKDVTGLYSGSGPYTHLAIGTFLTPIGGNMYTLTASRSDTKGFWVQVTNGATEFDIMVGNAAW